MKRLKLFALAVLALSAGAAQAQPFGKRPTTTICLDVGGQSLPAVCRGPASLIEQREDICTCPRGMPTTAPICPPGVSPPPESRALDRARRAAMRGGSLVGATWRGKPMCVARPDSGL
ncbi:MAG: hypothetical protein JWO33_1281 [Caulobacteraceae bacterium]|jgi:hypothetical protein|nr:hypothetical protein [Caulobacteraceae bacterium]